MNRIRIAATLSVVLVATALAGCARDTDKSADVQGNAEAACAATEVTVDPSPVVAGESATLTAINLGATCHDQGEGANPPSTGVTVSLVAQDGSWGPSDVATLDAGEDSTATATILLPSDTVPGAVLVSLDGVETAGFEVVAPLSPKSPEPLDTQSPVVDSDTEASTGLDQAFDDMIAAMAASGAQGLQQFLSNPGAGDVWGIAQWTWVPGDCVEGAPGESGCVGTFEKDGANLETVFMFDQIDGEWLLTDSWVEGESSS